MRKEDICAGIATFFVAASLNYAADHPEAVRGQVDALNDNRVVAMPKQEQLSPTTSVKIRKS